MIDCLEEAHRTSRRSRKPQDETAMARVEARLGKAVKQAMKERGFIYARVIYLAFVPSALQVFSYLTASVSLIEILRLTRFLALSELPTSEARQKDLLSAQPSAVFAPHELPTQYNF